MKKLNEKNPFLELLYDIKIGSKPSVYAKGESVSLVVEETGELKGRGFSAVVNEKSYDKEHFIKIYKAGREVMPKLSASASKLLWFLINGMGYNDEIALNMKKAKKVTGYKSDAAIYRAITELKENNILANGYRNGLYFINPTMFYRGNRLKLINTN